MKEVKSINHAADDNSWYSPFRVGSWEYSDVLGQQSGPAGQTVEQILFTQIPTWLSWMSGGTHLSYVHPPCLAGSRVDYGQRFPVSIAKSHNEYRLE